MIGLLLLNEAGKENVVTDIKTFQKKIGYQFQNEHLLVQALTHSSYANEKHMKKLSDRSKNQIRKFLEAEGVAIGNQFRWEFYWRKCDLEKENPDADEDKVRDEALEYANQEVLKMLDGFFNDYETWK